MSPARLLVRAIVVDDGRSPHLTAVLASVASQTVMPDVIHLVTHDAGALPELPDGVSWQVSEGLAGSYSDTIDAVLAAHESHSLEYLWLLHDDTAPLPDALARLVDTAKRRTAAGIIGAAQVTWEDVSRLVSVGATTTRVGARRVDIADEEDINQGQYDERAEMLAVSTAAALIRREVWERSGGLEPAYRGFGDSMHLSRLAWRAGYDVVLAPTARVRHAQLTLAGARASGRGTYGLRRAGEWTHALAFSRLPMIPVLVAWAFVSAVGRAVLRIAQNEARLVGADLTVPWRVLGRLPRLPGMRARIRAAATRPRAVVRPFLIGTRATVRHIRARELRAWDRWRALHAPSDLVRAELESAARRRRGALGLVVVALLAASVALHGTWLTAILSGRMLTSDALGVTDVTVQSLWERTWSGWSPAGLGTPALDGAFAALMLPAAVLPGGLRLWLGLLLALGVTLAGVGAWYAAGAATRSVWVRALAALAYALWPLHLQAISDGRVGAVLTHVVLPWLVLALARAGGWHRGEAVGGGEEFPARRLASPSAALGAAFCLAVIAVATPVLLAPLVAVTAVLGALAGRARWRVWGIPLPALVVSGPALLAAWGAGPLTAESWALLARENGPALASPVSEPWEIALGLDDALRGAEGWDQGLVTAVSGFMGILVVAAAVLAALSGRATTAVTIGLTSAALGGVTAVAAQHTVVVHADGAGQAAANGFAGPGASLMVAGLLAAAASASSRAWQIAEGRPRAVKRIAVVSGVVLASAAIASTVALEAWPGRAERGAVHAASTEVLPLVAALEQTQPARQRVMVLADAEDATVATVLESDGSEVLLGRAGVDAQGSPFARPGAHPATSAVLAPAAAGLVGAGEDPTPALEQWGVGVVVAAPGADRVAGALGQRTDLSLMGASEHGQTYRVGGGDAATTARAWIEGDQDMIALASDSWSGGTDEAVAGTLVIAAPADGAWRAQADGRALATVDDAQGRQAFTVPEGVTTVTYEYRDDAYRFWWWASVAVMAWAIVGMVPLHDRRFMAVRA